MARRAPAARKVRRLDRNVPERSKKGITELELKLDKKMERARKLMDDTASVQPRGQFIKSKAEEKEQAMNEEEDLEELTDGELEEVEKRFEGIKRKLRGVKNFVSDQYKKDHPLETPKLTEGGAKVLAEAESKVDDKKRLESREQQSMYKSNKVPKKVRPESPNSENDYQTQLDKPIQWKALEEKTRKVKKTLTQQGARKQKPRKGDTENPMTSTTDLPKTHNNLAYGMTSPENKQDTDLRSKVKLPRRGSLPKDGQKSPLKLTPQQTKQMSDKLVHAMFHDKPEFKRLVREPDKEKPEPDVATREPPKKEIPEEYPEWKKRVMRGDPNSRYWRDLASSRPLAWESWLQKYNESKRDKRIATRLNEMRAVTEGKVKPPTPKHLVKPAWKAWLEKEVKDGKFTGSWYSDTPNSMEQVTPKNQDVPQHDGKRTFGRGRGTGYTATMSPKEFLNLTPNNNPHRRQGNISKNPKDFYGTKDQSDKEKLRLHNPKRTTMGKPTLWVDHKTGKIMSHEGRHRARAIHDHAPNTAIPVDVVGNDKHESVRHIMPKDLKGQRRSPDHHKRGEYDEKDLKDMEDDKKWAKEYKKRRKEQSEKNRQRNRITSGIEALKSWEIWLEKKKDQGQGDARYGNPHETGMEDTHKLQTTRDDFSLENHDEDEKDKDNKPYKEREREERYE